MEAAAGKGGGHAPTAARPARRLPARPNRRRLPAVPTAVRHMPSSRPQVQYKKWLTTYQLGVHDHKVRANGGRTDGSLSSLGMQHLDVRGQREDQHAHKVGKGVGRGRACVWGWGLKGWGAGR